jgi:uncharacterized protein
MASNEPSHSGTAHESDGAGPDATRIRRVDSGGRTRTLRNALRGLKKPVTAKSGGTRKNAYAQEARMLARQDTVAAIPNTNDDSDDTQDNDEVQPVVMSGVTASPSVPRRHEAAATRSSDSVATAAATSESDTKNAATESEARMEAKQLHDDSKKTGIPHLDRAISRTKATPRSARRRRRSRLSGRRRSKSKDLDAVVGDKPETMADVVTATQMAADSKLLVRRAAVKLQRRFRERRAIRKKKLRRSEKLRQYRNLQNKSVQLAMAIKANDYNAVVVLIDEVAEQRLRFDKKWRDAAERPDKVDWCDVNMKDPTFGEPPIILACRLGYYNLVDILLNDLRRPHPTIPHETVAEVDVNATDSNGATALMRAAQNGWFVICMLLLHAGAVIYTRDNDGWSALLYAAANGHLHIVELLCDKRINKTGRSADMTSKSNYGETALMKAVNNGHMHVVTYLLRRSEIDVDAVDRDNNSVIMLAKYYGQIEMIKKLIRAGAKFGPTQKNRLGQSFDQVLPSAQGVRNHFGRLPHEDDMEEKRQQLHRDITDIAKSGARGHLASEVLSALENLRAHHTRGQHSQPESSEEKTRKRQEYDIKMELIHKATSFFERGTRQLEQSQFAAASEMLRRAHELRPDVKRYQLDYERTRASAVFKDDIRRQAREHLNKERAAILYEVGLKHLQNERHMLALMWFSCAHLADPSVDEYNDAIDRQQKKLKIIKEEEKTARRLARGQSRSSMSNLLGRRSSSLRMTSSRLLRQQRSDAAIKAEEEMRNSSQESNRSCTSWFW